jgi:hypothetical protein
MRPLTTRACEGSDARLEPDPQAQAAFFGATHPARTMRRGMNELDESDKPDDWLARPLVYVAGPYTYPDPEKNVNRVVDFADSMLSDGIVIPYVPHLTHLWHERRPRTLNEWYSYDLVILKRCDALFRLDGESHGADAEVKFAIDHDIPVFSAVEDLYAWCGHSSSTATGTDEPGR